MSQSKVPLREIKDFIKTYQTLTDEELMFEANRLSSDIASKTNVSEATHKIPSIALGAVASERALGLSPYDEQLIGAWYIASGTITEMKTGEGKTLTAAIAVIYDALKGFGVHVVTVNDYLAERDATQLAPLFEMLGLTVGYIYPKQIKSEKQKAYLCDITYGTNSEFGFDYLRDNMVVFANQRVQRGLSFAVIDEVDSILIDEARTPLIIASQALESGSQYEMMDNVVRQLLKDHDVEVDMSIKSCNLTTQGIEKVQNILGLDNLYSPENISLVHYLDNALKAHFAMFIDKDYVVQNEKVEIIDTFTGRVLAGRRYSNGLHQALEAKERVPLQNETYTSATITYQNYFKMYDKLSGMTGTAYGNRKEFKHTYGLTVKRVPTHKPVIRIDNPDKLFVNLKAKDKAIIEKIKEVNATGQPILVGSGSVEANERLSALLKAERIKHEVLNAKQHKREAEIIAKAGQKGAITLATNMAGRGTDILLGKGVAELGGLFVLGTERHESRRIDDQLRGRSGRQGDPGETQFYVSFEDDLMISYGGERAKRLAETLDEQETVQGKLFNFFINQTQHRVEGNSFDMRKQVLEFDEVLQIHRERIYADREKVISDWANYQDYLEGVFERVVTRIVEDNFYDKETLLDMIHSYLVEPHQLSLETINTFHSKKALLDFLLSVVDNRYKVKTSKYDNNVLCHFESNMVLMAIDSEWANHIDQMSKLKDIIGLQASAGIKPITAYQREGFRLFNETKWAIEFAITRFCLKNPISQFLERVQTNR